MQPYSELGLSEDLLQDGYAGVETINGRKYYCRTGSCDIYGGMASVLVVTATSFLLIWDSTPLIPAAALLLLSRVLKHAENTFSLLNARGETLARLVASAIRYGAGLFVIFYSLYLLGLDTSSVLRSLGAFSLIVGLGAQSLIKDIIAGIFVVFEGSYHVGDIVEINKFRGKVTEIALRTTKLENLDGNVMIFNNNAISNVENLSIHSSNVTCDLHLPKTLDPDEAKERILAELPEIRSRNPEIRGEIIYDGIIETNSTGYVVRLIVHCREHDRGRLWRRMNREMIELTRKLNLD